MIDTHIHVVPPNLPGAGALGGILAAPLETRALELKTQMVAAELETVLVMGCLDAGEDDPLGVIDSLRLRQWIPDLYAIGAMDPRKSNDNEHLRKAEEQIRQGGIKALKGYLGYLHFGPEHPGYRPYYELAERYRLPVIFHTGDTWSPLAKLKFAHPLLVDEVAVDHPRVNFVMAHVGNPWMIDAAEVMYKNLNVWADLSGLAVGNAEDFAAPERQETLQETLTLIRRTFRYAERPNRFVFGSDWPLAPLDVYLRWVATAIPEVFHPQVFEENARGLFRL